MAEPVVVEKTVEETYLEQIESMKKEMADMVDPVKYAELKKQHDTLLNDYVNKREVKKEETTIRKAKEIARELMENKPMTNKKYIETALEYRTAMINESGHDPFVDKDTDPAKSHQVAEHLREVLNESETDFQFRMKLNESLVDENKPSFRR